MNALKGEQGIASVFALALLTGLTVVIGATAAMAQWSIARSQVAIVADLAAVAAARQGACAAAELTARAHDVQLVECSWQGTDVTVSIGSPAVGPAARMLGAETIVAQSRAGF